MRRSSIVLAVLGVLLIAAAAVLRFAIVPAAKKLPGDTNSTAHYAGKATVLNATALLAGDSAHVLASDVDATADEHVYVTQTDGNTAILHDDTTLRIPGQPDLADNHTYAVDRTTLDSASAIGGVQVEKHSGLTVALPINPKADDSYKWYDPTTKTSVPLKFAGNDSRNGRDVLHYTAEATGEVADDALSKQLPAQLPKSVATGLVPLLPASAQAAFSTFGQLLPDPIPLSYTATSKYDLYVDKELGAPIDVAKTESVLANAEVAGQKVPLTAVLTLDLKSTLDSKSSATDDINSASTKLSLYGIWLPLGGLVVGILLILVAVLRRRRKAVATTAE